MAAGLAGRGDGGAWAVDKSCARAEKVVVLGVVACEDVAAGLQVINKRVVGLGCAGRGWWW